MRDLAAVTEKNDGGSVLPEIKISNLILYEHDGRPSRILQLILKMNFQV